MSETTTIDVQTQPSVSINPLHSLKKHHRISMVVWVLVILLGLPMVFIKGQSTYKVEAVFHVAPRYMKSVQSDAELELQSNSQYREYVNQLSQTVVRYDVLQTALQKTRERGIDTRPPALTERRYIETLQKAISVKPIPDTYMVRVSIEGVEKDKPYLHELINAVMASFLETSKSEQIYGSAERLNMLQETANKLHEEVADMQAERVLLGEKLGLTTFTDNVTNPYDSLLAGARDKHAVAVAERVRADAAYQAFLKSGEVPTDMGRSLLQMKQEDLGLSAFRAEVTARQEELNKSMAGLADKHPAREPALAELQKLNDRLREREDSFDRKTRDNFALRLLSTVNQRQQVEDEIGRALQQLESQATDYARTFQQAMQLTKAINDRESRLKQIGDRLNYLETESQALGWVRLVTPALPADLPQGVGKTKLLLVVIAAAFGLALAVPVIIDMTDRRIRGVGEVEKIMGMPAAGWQILREDLATDLYAEEQTRRFVSALIRLKARHERNVYAFSSVKTEGGATATILDTAACLQQLGSSVLVLEANSYAPNPLFDNWRPGLTDYLAGHADVADLAKPYTHHNAVVSVVGIGNERVRGLQRLDRLHEAIKQWSTQYEYVLVDLPPLLMSADAEMLIETIGQVFLVVEAQAVNRGEIGRSKRLLQKIDPEAVGLFVNKVPLFRGNGYMEDLIIETLSRSKLSSFMSLDKWKFQWEMWLTERSIRKNEKARNKKPLLSLAKMREGLLRLMSPSEWNLRRKRWLATRSERKTEKARQNKKRQSSARTNGLKSDPTDQAAGLQQALFQQAQQAQQAGQWAEASLLLLELADMTPSADSQFNAAHALLKQLENSEWDPTLGQLARDCTQRLEDLEGISARVSMLRQSYQHLEQKHHEDSEKH